jgi:hypothetical protein
MTDLASLRSSFVHSAFIEHYFDITKRKKILGGIYKL